MVRGDGLGAFGMACAGGADRPGERLGDGRRTRKALCGGVGQRLRRNPFIEGSKQIRVARIRRVATRTAHQHARLPGQRRALRDLWCLLRSIWSRYPCPCPCPCLSHDMSVTCPCDRWCDRWCDWTRISRVTIRIIGRRLPRHCYLQAMPFKQLPQITCSDVPFRRRYSDRAQGFECQRAPLSFPALPIVVVVLARPIFPTLGPGFDCLFSDDWVIPAPIAAHHESAHGPGFNRQPAAQVTTEARISSERLIVIRQARCRQLVPCGAPQQHCGSELVTGSHDGQLAVTQSRHIEGHEWHASQVNFRGNKRIHVRQPLAPGQRRPARAARSGSACR